jgi:predicted ATPase/DNA-binding winged helix-turn-helix (wHTH) protein
MNDRTADLAPALESCRFGRFELDAERHALLEDGQPVPLGSRAFDLLGALVTRAGELVTKRELLAQVWPGLVVEENNLQVQVSTLRKLLGASALSTIPGRGYRFNLRVLRAGESTPARVDAPQAPAPLSERARANLPGRLPRLYGRDADLAAIDTLLRGHAMVTVVGAGGIGKTRLAQAAAAAMRGSADYPDGVWWVELAALTDGSLIAATVAHAVGATLAENLPAVEALAAHLAPLGMLLVLDNCEHVSDAVADMVSALRERAPRVAVLVTSQETLKVSEEQVYRVGPLEFSGADPAHCGAVELFVARAQSADPNFALTPGNTAGVVEICRRLDGIPLAIEFAAARVPLLGVEGLRARLDERFNVLTAGARVVLRRHQTLRATLEWSHGLLTPDEQTAFRRFAVFAGGFCLEAAQQVASDDRIDPWTALDLLGGLVDKSLVLAEGDPVPRYRLLESARAYGLERLAEAGETQAMLRRHAEAVLATLSRFGTDWHWNATREDERAAGADLDNLRAALSWASAAPEGRDLAVPLAAASFPVWWPTRFAEGLDRCLALAPLVDGRVAKRDAARFWLTVARLGIYALRRESFEAGVRASALFRELGDDHRLFDALGCVAVQGTRYMPPQELEPVLAEVARLERPEWPARQRASVEFARCWNLAAQGRVEEALAAAHRQVAICMAAGAERPAMYAMSNVTSMELMLGRPEESLSRARAAIARLEALDGAAGAGHLYRNTAMALAMTGSIDEALGAARIAYSLLMPEGDEFLVLPTLAFVAAAMGRVEDAARVAAFHGAALARLVRNEEPLASVMRARLAPYLAALDDGTRARLTAEGAALRPADAFRIGFGDAS